MSRRILPVFCLTVGLLMFVTRVSSQDYPNGNQPNLDDEEFHTKVAALNVATSDINASEVELRLHNEWRLSIESDSLRERKNAVRQFVNYLKREIHLEVPEWWSIRLMNVRTGPRRSSGFQVTRNGGRWKENGRWVYSGASNIHEISPRVMELQFENEKLSLGVAEFMKTVDVRTEDRMAHPGAFAMSYRHHDDTLLIARFSDYGKSPWCPDRFVCYDMSNQSVRWVIPKLSMANGVRLTGITGPSGSFNSYVEVSADATRAFLWGGNEMAMYFNVFDIQDGKRLIRFSTKYVEIEE